MNDELDDKVSEYQNAILALAMCRNILGQYDLPQLLSDIGRANAIGPILEPTLWMKKHKAMNEDKALIEAGLPLWRFGR